MFQRILAPSDGSPESEKALPIATQIARAHEAELVLLCVIDHPGFTVRPASSDEVVEQEAADHMTEVEARLRSEGIRVRLSMERGPTAATLLDREKAEAPDLVVIASHGRTGLARFALGSTADRLVREGTAPVLVVHRSKEPARELVNGFIMLDGSGLGEGALAVAEQLVGRPLQSLTLFRTVADPEDRSAAQTYLDGAAARVATSGVKVNTAIDIGDPRVVAERAAKGYDVVILATHGRGGFDRWRHGSIADYVVRYLEQPVLLVRSKESR